MAGGGDAWWDGNPGAIYNDLFNPSTGLGEDAGGMMGAPQVGLRPDFESGEKDKYGLFSGSYLNGDYGNDLSAGGSNPFFFNDGNVGDYSFSNGMDFGGSYGLDPNGFGGGIGDSTYGGDFQPSPGSYGMDPLYQGSRGEEQGNDFLKKYKNAVAPFQGLLKNPIVSTLMSLNPTTALLKTVLGGPNSVGGFLGSMFGSGLGPIGSLAGGIGGSQLANKLTTGKFAPMTQQGLGSLFGNVAGGMTGNPYAAMLGGYVGGKGGNGESWNLQPTGFNNGLPGALMAGGLGLSANNNINNQIRSLEGMFGQNSSYAQQMRQQLERRDAAAGRRSQYGNREVELQAALAGNAAKLAPSLQQLYTQKMGNRNLLASTLMANVLKKPNIFQGLERLFGGNSGSTGGP